jgi:fimbrial chaperone protein
VNAAFLHKGARLIWVLALLGALTVAAVSAVSAMTVTPTHVELISAGSGNRAMISVVNTGSQPLPIEATVMRATLDEAGLPQTSKGGEDFLVMPPQALIAPGATQNFRIQWLGDPMLETSQSFLLYLSQIPVKLPATRNAVQVVMSIGVMINVAPPRGRPSLQVIETGVTTDSHGKRHPTITVLNPSKVHALLPQSTIRLAAGTWSTTITSGLLRERIGIGLVQPGRRRKFILPVELPASVGSIQAQLDFRPKP